MRAREPDHAGHVECDGVKIGYEVFGDGAPTLLLLPAWTIVHSRFWKLQVPYLSQHFRVVTFDARGNGRSDRPAVVEAYGPRSLERDAVAVLDAVGVDACVLFSHCSAAQGALLLAADHAERVRGALFFSPALPLTPPLPERTGHPFDAALPSYEGWAKANRHYWAQDFRGYLEFFFDRCYPEPHSTKPFEDCVGWALETTHETLALTMEAPGLDEATIHDLLGRLRCPLLVIQGDEDLLTPPDRGAAFALATGAELVELDGVGHIPQVESFERTMGALRAFLAGTPVR